jgi:hypothetical protein
LAEDTIYGGQALEKMGELATFSQGLNPAKETEA